MNAVWFPHQNCRRWYFPNCLSHLIRSHLIQSHCSVDGGSSTRCLIGYRRRQHLACLRMIHCRHRLMPRSGRKVLIDQRSQSSSEQCTAAHDRPPTMIDR